MGQNNVSLLNPIVVSLFRHHLYVTSVYWIIGIALSSVSSAPRSRAD